MRREICERALPRDSDQVVTPEKLSGVGEDALLLMSPEVRWSALPTAATRSDGVLR